MKIFLLMRLRRHTNNPTFPAGSCKGWKIFHKINNSSLRYASNIFGMKINTELPGKNYFFGVFEKTENIPTKLETGNAGERNKKLRLLR